MDDADRWRTHYVGDECEGGHSDSAVRCPTCDSDYRYELRIGRHDTHVDKWHDSPAPATAAMSDEEAMDLWESFAGGRGVGPVSDLTICAYTKHVARAVLAAERRGR